MLGFLDKWNVGRLEMLVFAIMHQQKFKVKNGLCKKFSKCTSIEIQSQNWGGNRQLSKEGIAVEYFPTSVDNVNNEEKYELHSYIRDDNEKYACDSHAHMIYCF